MATSIDDLIEGDVWQADDGWHAVRTYVLVGLTGAPHAIKYNACIDPNLPDFGDAHPSAPGTFVRQIRAVAWNADSKQCKVAVEYGPRPNGELADPLTAAPGTILTQRLTSSLKSKKRSRTRTGADVVDDQGTVRNVEMPQINMALRFSRIVSGLNANNFVNLIGHVNHDVWSGFAARTWLIDYGESNPIEGRTDGAYREDFEIEYDEETHDPESRGYFRGVLIAVDRPDILPQVDFSLLGISI